MGYKDRRRKMLGRDSTLRYAVSSMRVNITSTLQIGAVVGTRDRGLASGFYRKEKVVEAPQPTLGFHSSSAPAVTT